MLRLHCVGGGTEQNFVKPLQILCLVYPIPFISQYSIFSQTKYV